MGGVVLFKPGEVILGRYRVVEFANAGGQGIGWRGVDTNPDNWWEAEVFAKQYTDVFTGTEEAKELNEHFCKLRKKLSGNEHYLCLPRAVGEVNGSVVAIFPLVAGESLTAWLERDDHPLSPTQRVRFSLAVATAVRILSKAGVAHLDLKPDNILIEDKEQTYIRIIDTDAAQIDGRGLRREIIGTPWYQSPEHFNPNKYGPMSSKSDVFTLGIILFELLFGVNPFLTLAYKQEVEYEEAAESGGFEVPENSYHHEVVDVVVASLSRWPHCRPSAGKVHSVLHTHCRSNLMAKTPQERWVAPSCCIRGLGPSRFVRTYYAGEHLGERHFRGSLIPGLSSRFLRLRIDGNGSYVELTDNSVQVKLGGRCLPLGRELFFDNELRLMIAGTEFTITFQRAG